MLKIQNLIFFVISSALVLSAPFPTPATASSVEVQNHGISISAAQFNNLILSGAFYNVTGIQVGSEFYLYAQGGLFNGGPLGPGQAECKFADRIFLFKAPFTSSGTKGQFQFVRRITDCTSFTNNQGESQNHAYGPGQVFYDGEYRLLVDRSDTVDFKEIHLGTSSDGINWTWEYMFRSTSNIEILSPVLLTRSPTNCHCNPFCHCHTKWWGFLNFNTPTSQGVARMEVDWGPEYPRGFRVSIWSGSQWKHVDDVTGEFSFTPDNVWPGIGVKTLFKNGDHFELWGYKNVPHNGCAPCMGDYDNGFAGTTFVFREVDDDFSFQPPEAVFSTVRCMPSDGHVGRLYPFRVNGPAGEKFLFSSSNDQNICSDDPAMFNEFVGMYTLATQVDQ